jgi:hypothetical protein
VIVADSSTDDGFTQECILNSFNNNINVKIIKGGFPAEARNNGTKKIKTPYVLAKVIFDIGLVTFDDLEPSSSIVVLSQLGHKFEKLYFLLIELSFFSNPPALCCGGCTVGVVLPSPSFKLLLFLIYSRIYF